VIKWEAAMSLKQIVLVAGFVLSCTSCQLLFHDAGGAAGTDGGRAEDADGGSNTVDGGSRIDAAPRVGPNVIFATSETFTGDFGGIVAADAACRAAASAGNLSGNFIAVLSDGTTLPTKRFQQANGWVMPSGAPVADSLTDLGNGTAFGAITQNEKGLEGNGTTRIWTGATSGGYGSSDQLCNGWTVASATKYLYSGDTLYSPSLFADSTSAGSTSCAEAARFLCAEASQKVNVRPVPVQSMKFVFVSKATLSTLQGRLAADKQCKVEANLAGLEGEFASLLGNLTSSAISRFDKNAIYYRTDGVVLGTLGVPSAAINRGADYRKVIQSAVWGTNLGENPSFMTSCRNWSSNSSTDVGNVGYSNRAGVEAHFSRTYPTTYDCGQALPVYCAEL
jgi:hypothetical protein